MNIPSTLYQKAKHDNKIRFTVLLYVGAIISNVFNLLVGRFTKRPVCIYIYTGRWGEFETMEIRWDAENILSVDGRRYYAD